MGQLHAEDLVANGGYRDIAAAQKFCDGLRETAMANKQRCKMNRPWSIVRFDQLLDKDQPWLGFEYETGFDDVKDYEKAIAFLWDKQKYNAIDREGSGNFPFEIAFPPNTAAQFIDGTANIQGYINFLKENGLKQAHNPTTYTMRGIGIHVNISTPKSRAMKGGGRYGGPAYELGTTICGWLNQLGEKKEIELFGRYQRHWQLASGRETWIEFKCFKSTDDAEAHADYVRVSLRLAELVDWAVDKKPSPKNLYEFLSGKDDTLKG